MMSCPFKLIEASFYDLDEECEGKLIPIHPDDDRDTLMMTRYCSRGYKGNNEYWECVGEDRCPIMKK